MSKTTWAVEAKPSDQNGDYKKIPSSKVYDLFVPEEWLQPGTFWKNILANKFKNFWGNKNLISVIKDEIKLMFGQRSPRGKSGISANQEIPKVSSAILDQKCKPILSRLKLPPKWCDDFSQGLWNHSKSDFDQNEVLDKILTLIRDKLIHS